MELNECTTIVDEKKFFESHKEMVSSNPNNKTFLPYKERLELYMEIKNKLNGNCN